MIAFGIPAAVLALENLAPAARYDPVTVCDTRGNCLRRDSLSLRDVYPGRAGGCPSTLTVMLLQTQASQEEESAQGASCAHEAIITLAG